MVFLYDIRCYEYLLEWHINYNYSTEKQERNMQKKKRNGSRC
jgi:hypothetical protein